MDIPNSCSLTAPEMVERRRAFARLPLIEDAGGRLRYRDEPGVEEALRELIRLEAECCPDISFSLTREKEELVLAIEA